MATIFDVARLAGVSIKTVSRVVNREASIRPATMAKVHHAVELLGYEPHRGARLMRSGKSGLIGVITGVLSGSDLPATSAGLSDLHLLRGAQRACSAAGKTLLIADMAGDPQVVESLLRTFVSHRVEGVIYTAPYHQQVILPRPKNTPLVLVNCFDLARTPAMVPDDALGQERVVDFLVGLGHRRIGYVGLNEDMVAGRLRKAAFVAACARHGLDARQCPVRVGATPPSMDPFTPLAAVLQDIVQRPLRPTALCMGNDVMALHAIRLLEGLGVSVPRDIALMGYDDDAKICEATRPRLSTVSLPYYEMGQAAVERLLDDHAGRPPPLEPWRRIAGEIVVRDSAPALEPRAAPPRLASRRRRSTTTST